MTRRGLKVRRLHKHFAARFWGRGKHKTKFRHMNSPKCGHSFASLWPHCYHQRCTIPAVLIRSSLKRSTHSPVNHNYPHQHTLATFPIVMMSRCSSTQYLNHLDMTDELSSKLLWVHLIQRTNTHMPRGQLLLRLAALASICNTPGLWYRY